jgi:hypothetical protein
LRWQIAWVSWSGMPPLSWSLGGKPYSKKPLLLSSGGKSYLYNTTFVVIRNATFVVLWWEALLWKKTQLLVGHQKHHFCDPLVGSLTLKSHFCCPLVGSHASRTPLSWWSETPLLWSLGGQPYSLKTRNFSWVIRNATFVVPLWEALL